MRIGAIFLIAVSIVGLPSLPSVAGERQRSRKQDAAPRQPDGMPLALQVRRPEDLVYKQVTEREYLIFNLLANAKLAYDAGHYSDAAQQWEALLKVPDLDGRIADVVRPLIAEANQKAPSSGAAVAPVASSSTEPAPVAEEDAHGREKTRSPVDVVGTISGGGSAGPGSAVVWLKRANGRTPAPPSGGEYSLHQTRKSFSPHILTVPLGATVSFRNDDPIFHDVFSITPQSPFDLGLYKSGLTRTQTFTHPGATELFCNIHAQMHGWIMVVDSPWYATSTDDGRFKIRNVPPGDYKLEVWHEGSSRDTTLSVTVAQGMSPLSLTVGGDRQRPAAPPDKFGKPRVGQIDE